MKTSLEDNSLVIRDRPLAFWLFYSFFVAGGSIALVLSLSAAPDTTTAIIGSVFGIGNITDGFYMIKREPAANIEINKAAGEVQVWRWYPFAKRQKAYPISSLSRAAVEKGEYSEGGSVFRPRLGF